MLSLLVHADNPLAFVQDPRVAEGLRAALAKTLGVAKDLVGLLYVKLAEQRRLQPGSGSRVLAAFDARADDDDQVRQMAMRLQAESTSSLELAVVSQLNQASRL